MAETYYFLDYDGSRLVYRVGVNGIPVGIEPAGEPLKGVRSINAFLKPGQNELTTFLDWPRGRNYVPGVASLEAQVFEADPAHQMPTPLRTLARFRWPVPADEKLGRPAVPEAYPYQSRVPFEAVDAVELALWTEAEPIAGGTLSPTDRLDLANAINEFQRLLAAREYEAAYEIARFRYEDEARALYKSPAQMRQTVIDMYSDLERVPGVQPVPFDPDSANLQVVGEDRLVLASRADGTRCVLFRNEEGRTLPMHVMFARVDQQWVIAR